MLGLRIQTGSSNLPHHKTEGPDGWRAGGQSTILLALQAASSYQVVDDRRKGIRHSWPRRSICQSYQAFAVVRDIVAECLVVIVDCDLPPSACCHATAAARVADSVHEPLSFVDGQMAVSHVQQH